MSIQVEAFARALKSPRPIALDTSACIYYLGRVEPWFGLVDALMGDALEGRRHVHISSIVQLELLVRPIRYGNRKEIRRVLTFTDHRPGVQLIDVNRSTVMAAAAMRARAGLKLADAIVAASAALSGCLVLVGNDRSFRSLNSLSARSSLFAPLADIPGYVHLDDFVDGA